MKKSKMMAIAFAILAGAASARAEGNVIDFDGKAGAQSFAQLAAEARFMPVEAEPAVIPVRLSPEFTRKQVVDMDKSIDSAIAYVNLHGQGADLAAGFECLKNNGTPEQKYAFVYQPAGTVYSLPENCVMRNKGVCQAIFDTVCKTVTYVACAIMADGSKECHDEAREDCKVVKKCLFAEE